MVSLGWTLDPVLIGTLLTLAITYVLLAGPLRSRVAPGARLGAGQTALFVSGLAVAFLAEASPLHDLSDRYLFSAHMVQHLLLSYVVAPLLIGGTPGWMVRPLLDSRLGPAFRLFTRPLVAFVVFALAFSLWHLPFVYEAALGNDFMHHSQHVIFLLLAVMVWWPVMSPLPEMPRLGYGMQVFYLVALPLGQFFVAAILTFAPVPFYPTYAHAPRVIHQMSATADQQLGGVIMKIASFIAFGIPLVVVFLRWFAGDRPLPGAREPLG
jgi:putative membrane protein